MIPETGMALPAAVISHGLIGVIRDVVGVYVGPAKRRREAFVESEARLLAALAAAEVQSIEQEARHFRELREIRHLNNLREIAHEAMTYLRPENRAQDIDRDWIDEFFDNCKNITDNDIRSIFARILAGEANSPGAYSRRTLAQLKVMSKAESKSFARVARNQWCICRDESVNSYVLTAHYKPDEIVFPYSSSDVSTSVSAGLIYSQSFMSVDVNLKDCLQFGNHRYDVIEPHAVYVAKLTSTGQEIFRAIGGSPDYEFEDAFVVSMAREKLKLVRRP